VSAYYSESNNSSNSILLPNVDVKARALASVYKHHRCPTGSLNVAFESRDCQININMTDHNTFDDKFNQVSNSRQITEDVRCKVVESKSKAGTS